MNPRLDLLGNIDRLLSLGPLGHLMGMPFANPGKSFTLATGVPIDGTKGYAKSALWFNTKNGGIYENVGTNASSTWVPHTAGGAAVQGVAAGYKIARGITALDGANPTPVATGLTTVVAATLTLQKATAPGVGTCLVTIDNTDFATGQLDVYAWKPTASGDCTLIASTGTESFEWIAVGN